MNKYNLYDDVYFIKYDNGEINIECMRIFTAHIDKFKNIIYTGTVYLYDPDTNEKYICDECDFEKMYQENLFSTKKEAINHLKTQIEKEDK
ncbi:MAG TPA: hypothetical protein VFE53_06385 [Mucilaginibacter sp.]|jgi:hypothetical protein|nr:hypothetical protein [Mucilaginibacter sp.]